MLLHEAFQRSAGPNKSESPDPFEPNTWLRDLRFPYANFKLPALEEIDQHVSCDKCSSPTQMFDLRSFSLYTRLRGHSDAEAAPHVES